MTQHYSTPERTGRKKGWPTACARVSPEELALIDSALSAGGYSDRNALVYDAVMRTVKSVLERRSGGDRRKERRADDDAA